MYLIGWIVILGELDDVGRKRIVKTGNMGFEIGWVFLPDIEITECLGLDLNVDLGIVAV
jgi:hypothetical protein